MDADDIMQLAVRMRDIQQHGPSGPLAIVMPREKYDQFARTLGILAVPDRPGVFTAQAWLEEPEIRDWTAAQAAPRAY